MYVLILKEVISRLFATHTEVLILRKIEKGQICKALILKIVISSLF